jgi:hypothetical protein
MCAIAAESALQPLHADLDCVQVLLAGPACELHDAVQLVHGAAARENGLAI